jgi:hypothetical protein
VLLLEWGVVHTEEHQLLQLRELRDGRAVCGKGCRGLAYEEEMLQACEVCQCCCVVLCCGWARGGCNDEAAESGAGCTEQQLGTWVVREEDVPVLRGEGACDRGRGGRTVGWCREGGGGDCEVEVWRVVVVVVV